MLISQKKTCFKTFYLIVQVTVDKPLDYASLPELQIHILQPHVKGFVHLRYSIMKVFTNSERR